MSREDILIKLMEVGQKLETLPTNHKVDINLIKGCQSKVWLVSNCLEGNVYYQADSNTDIVKGILYLLIQKMNGNDPNYIKSVDITVLNEMGIDKILGKKRKEGVLSILDKMKKEACKYL